jgi:hypothetical protein
LANYFHKGQYEIIRKGDPAVVGVTKLDGITLEDLKRPRKVVAPTELLADASKIESPATKLPDAPSS